MIFGKLILISIPLLLAALGIVCAEREKDGIFCILFGISVFCVTGAGLLGETGFCGAEGEKAAELWKVIKDVPFEEIGQQSVSPAYAVIMKICASLTDDVIIFATVIAVIQAGLSAAAVYSLCSTPYEGALVAACSFMFTSFVSSSLYIAALICLFGARYITEQRFFRFAAAALAASCFDISAVITIPLYFITLIPNVYIAAAAVGALSVSAAVFDDITVSVFEIIGGVGETHGTEPGCALFAAFAAIICLLMHRMIAHREEKLERLIPALTCGAGLALAGAFTDNLSSAAIFMTMPALTILAPEVYAIGSKFITILFPENKKTSEMIFGAVCIAVLTGICIYITLNNVFGTDSFCAALSWEVPV